MFGMKAPKVPQPHTPRPAMNMPGLRRGSMPGMQRGATMPKLTGGLGYDDLVRQSVMDKLKGK